MEAVIFDIDGTLLQSDANDDTLYLAAVRDVLGNVNLRPSWGRTPNSPLLAFWLRF